MRGSITTATPETEPVSATARSISFSAAYWIASSIVSTTVWPSVEGFSVVSIGRRRASMRTLTFAARPRIRSSKAYSMPLMPVLSSPT